MIKEKVEERLRLYLYNLELKEQLGQELQFLEEDLGAKGIAYDSISTAVTNVISDTTHDKAMKRIGQSEGIKNRIKEIDDELQSIDTALSILPDRQRQVIELYYISNLPMYEVAKQVGKSIPTVERDKRKALDTIIKSKIMIKK